MIGKLTVGDIEYRCCLDIFEETCDGKLSVYTTVGDLHFELELNESHRLIDFGNLKFGILATNNGSKMHEFTCPSDKKKESWMSSLAELLGRPLRMQRMTSTKSSLSRTASLSSDDQDDFTMRRTNSTSSSYGESIYSNGNSNSNDSDNNNNNNDNNDNNNSKDKELYEPETEKEVPEKHNKMDDDSHIKLEIESSEEEEEEEEELDEEADEDVEHESEMLQDSDDVGYDKNDDAMLYPFESEIIEPSEHPPVSVINHNMMNYDDNGDENNVVDDERIEGDSHENDVDIALERLRIITDQVDSEEDEDEDKDDSNNNDNNNDNDNDGHDNKKNVIINDDFEDYPHDNDVEHQNCYNHDKSDDEEEYQYEKQEKYQIDNSNNLDHKSEKRLSKFMTRINSNVPRDNTIDYHIDDDNNDEDHSIHVSVPVPVPTMHHMDNHENMKRIMNLNFRESQDRDNIKINNNDSNYNSSSNYMNLSMGSEAMEYDKNNMNIELKESSMSLGSLMDYQHILKDKRKERRRSKALRANTKIDHPTEWNQFFYSNRDVMRKNSAHSEEHASSGYGLSRSKSYIPRNTNINKALSSESEVYARDDSDIIGNSTINQKGSPIGMRGREKRKDPIPRRKSQNASRKSINLSTNNNTGDTGLNITNDITDQNDNTIDAARSVTDSAEWSRLLQWLEELDLLEYAPKFREHGIERLSVIELLDISNMRQMNIPLEVAETIKGRINTMSKQMHRASITAMESFDSKNWNETTEIDGNKKNKSNDITSTVEETQGVTIASNDATVNSNVTPTKGSVTNPNTSPEMNNNIGDNENEIQDNLENDNIMMLSTFTPNEHVFSSYPRFKFFMLILFDEGKYMEFFNIWDQIVILSATNVEQFWMQSSQHIKERNILELMLHIYYRVHPIVNRFSKTDNDYAIDQFNQYIDKCQWDSDVLHSPEYAIYSSIALSAQPQKNPVYAHLFDASWSSAIRIKLIGFIELVGPLLVKDKSLSPGKAATYLTSMDNTIHSRISLGKNSNSSKINTTTTTTTTTTTSTTDDDDSNNYSGNNTGTSNKDQFWKQKIQQRMTMKKKVNSPIESSSASVDVANTSLNSPSSEDDIPSQEFNDIKLALGLAE